MQILLKDKLVLGPLSDKLNSSMLAVNMEVVIDMSVKPLVLSVELAWTLHNGENDTHAYEWMRIHNQTFPVSGMDELQSYNAFKAYPALQGLAKGFASMSSIAAGFPNNGADGIHDALTALVFKAWSAYKAVQCSQQIVLRAVSGKPYVMTAKYRDGEEFEFEFETELSAKIAAQNVMENDGQYATVTDTVNDVEINIWEAHQITVSPEGRLQFDRSLTAK